MAVSGAKVGAAEYAKHKRVKHPSFGGCGGGMNESEFLIVKSVEKARKAETTLRDRSVEQVCRERWKVFGDVSVERVDWAFEVQNRR